MDVSVLQLSRKQPQHAPMWMGILNITPDSFSEDGVLNNEEALKSAIQKFDELNIGIIDIGGESTRPDAWSITEDTEWERIERPLKLVNEHFAGRKIRPLVSLDSRNFKTVRRALEYGINIINDVSGLADDRFIPLLKNSQCQYILTHSLSVPASPSMHYSRNIDVIKELKQWFTDKIQYLVCHGINPEKIIIDPGIGFGKTSLQSQTILQNISEFYCFELRVLVGHSRKSFLTPIISTPPKERDIESLGLSLSLVNQGVDILRVHNPELHIKAFKGWNFTRSNVL